MVKHVETELVFSLKMLVLSLVVRKDLVENLAKAILLVLRLETTPVAVPPLALKETHQA